MSRPLATGRGEPSAAIARPVIAGNWKMHKSPSEAAAFFDAFLSHATLPSDRTVAFFPSALSFAAARAALDGRTDILLGVQNIHWESHGAFTGEVSAEMAADAGAALVLCGHSERRNVFGETDEQVGRKAVAALGAGLMPMICVGETLEEREAGRVEDTILRQLDTALANVQSNQLGRVLLAYEPVWAIGTGRTATPADAAAAHAVLRARLVERDTREAATAERAGATVPILYGGSVKPENAAELLAARDVDGLLVGGASLDPDGFARIATAG